MEGRVARERVWLVVEGWNLPAEEAQAVRTKALAQQVAMIVVARTQIDQSFEPRVIPSDATAR